MINRLNYPNFLLCFAILVIVIALVMQFLFGILPCKLCYYQRIPYYMIIGFGLLRFFINHPLYSRMFLWVCVILFFVSAVLGFYHMGIEYGYFKNILNCVAGNNEVSSVTELKSMLIGKVNIPCEVTGFKFGFSLSGWNFFISLILGFSTLYYIFVKK